MPGSALRFLVFSPPARRAAVRARGGLAGARGAARTLPALRGGRAARALSHAPVPAAGVATCPLE